MNTDLPDCPHCDAAATIERVQGTTLWTCSCCARTFSQQDLDRKRAQDRYRDKKAKEG